jgi:hypothetical protein
LLITIILIIIIVVVVGIQVSIQDHDVYTYRITLATLSPLTIVRDFPLSFLDWHVQVGRIRIRNELKCLLRCLYDQLPTTLMTSP